jgi:hypothetical protein
MLSEEEMKLFEERTKSDKDFRDRVSAVTFLSKGIKERQERDAKAIKDAKKISKEDVISIIKEIEKREQRLAAASSRIIPLWVKRIASAAAVILIVAGIGFDYNNSVVLRDNAEQGVLFAESNMPGDNFRGEGEDVAKDLRVLFENVRKKENLSLTIVKLEDYYNHAIDEDAHVEDDYVDQISFALVSAYIYDGQKSKAKEVLSHILNDPEASPDVKEKAKRLLDSIKKTFIF